MINFTLNGRATEIAGEPNTPLLYTLRNDCDAKGVRFGCGAGNCGACMVLIDGVAQPSCTTANWVAADKQVQTAEGLAADPIGALVLQAFIAEQAAQCGYCINGMLMSLTALFKANPQADETALRSCLDRHLCRCGTHLRILRAARHAAELIQAL